MANTYTSLQYHVVFSTKKREPWLVESVCERLWPYLGGIARENGMKALEIGGVADHIHLLLVLPPSLALSKALQLLKGASSRWIHDNFPALSHFGWQDGYGAFTVSESQIPVVREYIRNQPEHHRVTTFAEEYQTFMERHGIEFDERYLLG
ncbi:IS200/IS605 family transposase [Actomonas aquatica]|uniref:IS200/IS605 family transposase n=1 Tax=Actomonas aquatica TaxID=2866162 RepID=A0ABZ1C7P8_9BACT|nr:IS200/IS605 family transposase [Opitutus sp. WL0086]WRQ87734.1 IS200/IS605 family transposase [Opitutus sp. WL0086]